MRPILSRMSTQNTKPEVLKCLDDPLFTPEETAGNLGTNIRTLERWRSTGEGPEFVKIGRRVAYRRSALEAWLKRQTRRQTDGRRAA